MAFERNSFAKVAPLDCQTSLSVMEKFFTNVLIIQSVSHYNNFLCSSQFFKQKARLQNGKNYKIIFMTHLSTFCDWHVDYDSIKCLKLSCAMTAGPPPNLKSIYTYYFSIVNHKEQMKLTPRRANRSFSTISLKSLLYDWRK